MKIITIGRDPKKNDVVINDDFVGRIHLQLIQDDLGNVRLNDLNTRNGTYVNGQKINGEVLLNQYDVIRIGNHTLPWKSYFEKSGNTPPATTPPKEKWWKKINWRNVLGVITTILSLVLTAMMVLRFFK